MHTHGWTPIASTAIATKVFQTVVGPKEAFVYLEFLEPPNAKCMLMGKYVSEGRNALESCLQLLDKAAPWEALEPLVDQFCRDAERLVSETYGVRLLQHEDEPARPGPRG